MTPSSPENPVAKHFDAHARDFDAIYDSDKGLVRTLRDRVRGTVVQRLDYINDLGRRLQPRRVLDIGCGSGRFCVSLAQQGAEVVGLDFAPEMLTLARQKATAANVSGKCTFLEEDFLTWQWDEAFDLVLAVGVLDYIAEADQFLARIAEATRGCAVVSFPRLLHPLVPLRYARLRMAGCPVFFYGRDRVAELAQGRFERWEIVPFGRDYLLVTNAP